MTALPASGSRILVAANIADRLVCHPIGKREGARTNNHVIDVTRPPMETDDLSREVYGIFGIPIDVVDMSSVLKKIAAAASDKTPFFLSTPNLNFLITSLRDPVFRESLLASDLCPVDGMPIVALAKLLGVPITDRVAGSDIFQSLKSTPAASRRLSVFLFGGADGVAAAAANALNGHAGALTCVGSFNPGFGDLDALSTDEIIDTINSTNADFLVAALSAKKGQDWLMRNRHRLRIPVRSHLGAVLNMEAGTIRRAPRIWRKLGLEWLWRIKEEPYLWRRYWQDGSAFIHLLLTRALPIAFETACQRTFGAHRAALPLQIHQSATRDVTTLVVSGDANDLNIAVAVTSFRAALEAGTDINIDMADVRAVDPRFLGLLLMLRKQLQERGQRLSLLRLSSRIARRFHRNEFSYLVEPGT